MEFSPQGSMPQISYSSDETKLSFVIFLQTSPSDNTEKETHKRQKKKLLMNFSF